MMHHKQCINNIELIFIQHSKDNALNVHTSDLFLSVTINQRLVLQTNTLSPTKALMTASLLSRHNVYIDRSLLSRDNALSVLSRDSAQDYNYIY